MHLTRRTRSSARSVGRHDRPVRRRPAEARISQPAGQAAEPARGITFDAAGNLYFADSGNNRIRKIDIDGVMTTVGGTGERGQSGDGGNALLDRPYGIELDADKNSFIAHNYKQRIRLAGG